jgi:hypothetical protein
MAPGQPPRPHHRRHRHRQDRHPAVAGRAASPTSACRSSWPTSRATSPASAPPGTVKPKLQQRLDARHRRLRALRQPGGASGTCSASRPSGARHRLRHGAAAARAPAQPQRHPGRRAQLVFKIADDNGLLLLDLKDLRAMVQHVGDNAKQFTTSTATSRPPRSAPSSAACCAGRAGRRPVLRRADARHRRPDADRRRRPRHHQHPRRRQADNAPKLYSTFLLWLLAELFEQLPEVGDLDKPKLVFFFDEAHLLFNDAPQGAARQDRAGGAPDPLQGRRRLLRHPEPARRARHRARPARQPRPARAARLHPARPEGGQDRGADHARQNPKFDAEAAITELGVPARRWSPSSTKRAALHGRARLRAAAAAL